MPRKKVPSAFINGSQVVHLYTLGSKFDEYRIIEAHLDNGERLRLDVQTLLPLLQGKTLELRKKSVYRHIVAVK